MKILFYIGSLGKGGAERVISNLANYLVNDNEVIIMTDLKRNSKYKLNENVTIFSLDKDDNVLKFKIFKIFNNIKRLKNMNKTLNKIKPDAIISFLPNPSYRILLLKRIIKVPVIISVRNDPNAEYNNFIKKFLVKVLYSRANGFVFQTEEARNWFSKKIQDKSAIIPNPINPDFICEPYKGEREKTIINIGRLAQQKNQKLLIDAFYEIQKKYPDYILKIYGEGKLREKLEEQINELKLENKVFLMGIKDNIKEEIYKAGMFVLSSDFEGMPNTLMEAMALGLPCISTDCPCGGPKFLIKDKENGLLTEVGNKEELIDAIKYIINNQNEAKKMGNNANKICKILNPNLINDKWKKYIEDIIKENN